MPNSGAGKEKLAIDLNKEVKEKLRWLAHQETETMTETTERLINAEYAKRMKRESGRAHIS